MHSLEDLYKAFQEELSNYNLPVTPGDLYDPITYILNLGGKRVRPLFTLLSCEMIGGDVKKALKPALALEVFHNFSLIFMQDPGILAKQLTLHPKSQMFVCSLGGFSAG